MTTTNSTPRALAKQVALDAITLIKDTGSLIFALSKAAVGTLKTMLDRPNDRPCKKPHKQAAASATE